MNRRHVFLSLGIALICYSFCTGQETPEAVPSTPPAVRECYCFEYRCTNTVNWVSLKYCGVSMGDAEAAAKVVADAACGPGNWELRETQPSLFCDDTEEFVISTAEGLKSATATQPACLIEAKFIVYSCGKLVETKTAKFGGATFCEARAKAIKARRCKLCPYYRELYPCPSIGIQFKVLHCVCP